MLGVRWLKRQGESAHCHAVRPDEPRSHLGRGSYLGVQGCAGALKLRLLCGRITGAGNAPEQWTQPAEK